MKREWGILLVRSEEAVLRVNRICGRESIGRTSLAHVRVGLFHQNEHIQHRVRNMGPECARIMGGYWVCMQGSRVTQPMYTTIYTDQTMAPFSPDRLGTRPCCTRIINGNICTQHSAHYDLSCISDHQQNSAQTGRSAHETRLVPTPTIAAAAAITTTTFNARANAIAMAISFHIRNEILEMDGV